MPLLLHNWKEIVGLWLGALGKSDDEGLKAILECVPFPESPVLPSTANGVLAVYSKNLHTTWVQH